MKKNLTVREYTLMNRHPTHWCNSIVLGQEYTYEPSATGNISVFLTQLIKSSKNFL